MKKHSFIWLSLVVVMIFSMMMSSALTVFAAGGTNTVTIHPNGQEGLGGEDRFAAYAVFDGTLGTEAGELVGLSWGDGVDSDKLVAAMKNDATAMKSGKTFGAEFTEAWNDWSTSHSAEYDEALAVARFLAETEHYNDPAYAQTFARLVGSNLKDGYSPVKSTLAGNDWVITLPDNGYYLIKDTYSGTAASVSSYIIGVAGEMEIDLKATLPTVDKEVEGGNAALAGTYEDVSYTLTGTVSENIGVYDSYIYKFIDTLSSGLSAKVDTVVVKVTGTGLSEAVTLAVDSDYTVTLAPSGTEDAEHVLTVAFDDLKKVLTEKAPALNLSDPDVAKSIVVTVDYKAALNEHAIVGSEGNPNDVKLEYSNNPYVEGTGTTSGSEVKTYAIGLQIVKKDENGEVLEGVVFKLKRADGQYATFKQTNEDGEEVCTVTGWNTVGDELVTDAEGLFNIHGLDLGKYTLEEIRTKENYELMKPVSFTISSDEPVTILGDLGTISLSCNNTARDDVSVTSEDFANHAAQMSLVNNPSPILPHTGGIGAGIVIGLSALAILAGGGAVAFAALRKKKSN